MIIIVGSTATFFHEVTSMSPKDLDVWGDLEIPPYSCDYSQMPDEVMNEVIHVDYFATPDSIYTITLSHLGWDSGRNDLSPHGGSLQWDKYKKKALMLKYLGYKIIPKLYEVLIEHWKKEFGNKEFLSLKKNDKEFFNDYVKYVYKHDDLHEMVSYPNRPIYSRCLLEGEEVLIDKSQFDLLSFEDKVKMFKEEITVIAIERFLLHTDNSELVCYLMSLKKTITNLTKGWATEFIIFNLEHFKLPDMKMFYNFNNRKMYYEKNN
jgi:hypothetical protein